MMIRGIILTAKHQFTVLY